MGASKVRSPKVLTLFGTRPEIIKLAPVVRELERRGIDSVVVSSSQHKQLLKPFIRLLGIRVDHDLGVMRPDQGPNQVCSRVVAKLDKILEKERPELLLVQGDTTTTLAGAIAGFNRRVPVGHVEAGLRSGDINSPFPEEMNRRVVSQIASLHFAATEGNRRNLIAEVVSNERIVVTGNPVVDSLERILASLSISRKIRGLFASTNGLRRILLTTHRRESFGETMSGNLLVLRDFVRRHKDVCLIFPVHPNPNVRKVTEEILAGGERIFLLEPLDYTDFIALMDDAWLIVSDSGGVQEEAPSLGKPLLVLRENTERPEAIESGVAKLVGSDPVELSRLLEENYMSDEWIKSVSNSTNPFGGGDASIRIVDAIQAFIN